MMRLGIIFLGILLTVPGFMNAGSAFQHGTNTEYTLSISCEPYTAPEKTISYSSLSGIFGAPLSSTVGYTLSSTRGSTRGSTLSPTRGSTISSVLGGGEGQVKTKKEEFEIILTFEGKVVVDKSSDNIIEVDEVYSNLKLDKLLIK